MILLVSGSKYTRLKRPVTNAVARGAKTVQRFASSRTPKTPEDESLASSSFLAGYVRASRIGAAVWTPK